MAKVKYDPRNLNKGTDEGRDLVRRSLENYGAGRSILIDKEDYIIAGNKTMEAAEELGIPVRVIETNGKELIAVKRSDLGIDSKEGRELSIADNRSSEIGLDWDTDELATLLDEGDVNLSEFFSDEDIAVMLPQDPKDFDEPEVPKDEEVGELEKKWGTERGQLWTIGSHRLLCGDSTDETDVIRLMDGRRAALFATDPPYLVEYTGLRPKKDGVESGKDWTDHYFDDDIAKEGEGLYDGFIGVAVREALEPNAAWYCWHASQQQMMVQQTWEKHGAFSHQTIVWVKTGPVFGYSWYMWQHEPCFFGWVKGNKPRRNPSDEYPTTVWTFPARGGEREENHPTSKPIEIFEIPILQHTLPGEICYEPFSGSGSQIIAAERQNRKCYAMEIEPGFVAVTLERLSMIGLEPHNDI